MYKITISNHSKNKVITIPRASYPYRDYGFTQLLDTIRETLIPGDRTVVVTGDYFDKDMINSYERVALANNCNLDVSMVGISIYSKVVAVEDTKDTFIEEQLAVIDHMLKSLPIFSKKDK